MIEPVRDAQPSLPTVRHDDPRTAAEAVLFATRFCPTGGKRSTTTIARPWPLSFRPTG